MKNQTRDIFIDILKGIGITSIVIGHSSWNMPLTQFPIGPFVYTYHIMLFFFVAGMCFRPQKNVTPYHLVGKRLGGLLPLYVKYSVFFVLIHNILKRMHILDQNSIIYGKTDILNQIANSCVLSGTEQMLGAFWFVPMFFVGVSMFLILYYQAEKVRCSKVAHALFALLTAVVGVWLNCRQSYLQYHIQTSFLGVAVIYLGYLFQQYRSTILKYIKWWMAIIFGLFLWKLLALNIGIVELSVNQIIQPLLFYPVTIIGILFCICIAQALEKVKRVGEAFAVLGKNSYHIMALHFFVFKLIDLFYGRITGADVETISHFPYAFENLWLVYYICGVGIPVLIIYILKKGTSIVDRGVRIKFGIK